MLSIREANNVSILMQGCEINVVVQNVFNIFLLDKNNIEKIAIRIIDGVNFLVDAEALDRESCNVQLMNFLY